MRKVCDWFLVSDQHDLLSGLLVVQQEFLCLDYMGYYHTFLTDGLFITALELNSADFMQEALKLEAFDKSIYNKKKVITTMLSFFESDGSKTNFILNVLLLIDIS
jgi:hypothetical protein